jgi:protein FLOWERING LOCUS T
MHLNPDLLVDEPDVEIGGSGTFTLMVVDPDVPTPHKPKLRSWLLWLAINIPPHDVKRGEVVVPYEAPAPTGGKRDAHRVLYLLFKQKGRVQSRPPADRRGFQVKAWAQDHNLEKNPATGLFFWTSADEE